MNDALLQLPRSGIRRISDRLTERSEAYKGVIHLGLGQPQEPTPDAVCRAASEAALKGFTKYTPNAGVTELRRAISDKLASFNSAETSLDDVFVTPGATYAVSIAIGAILNPGDEALVPDPGYPNFAAAVTHYGGKVRYYQLSESNGFQLDVAALDKLITTRTKLLIINSPSNPTGAVIPRETIEALVAWTRERGLWLLCDEVYEAFTFGVKHVSPLEFPDTDHVIGIYSFSKTYNMTGLRVGYIATRNRSLHPSLIKAQELYISCAPSTSQLAALEALRQCGPYVDALRKRFHEKRDLVLSMLGDTARYEPQGAFYLLLDISATGLSSDDFADRLLEERGVAVAPGSTFGPSSDRFIRIAFTPEKDALSEGVERIQSFVREAAAA